MLLLLRVHRVTRLAIIIIIAIWTVIGLVLRFEHQVSNLALHCLNLRVLDIPELLLLADDPRDVIAQLVPLVTAPMAVAVKAEGVGPITRLNRRLRDKLDFVPIS